ncbi:MAG: prepilin peptidase [Lachnospiraceae bacterium]|nr:prepilin peptidase [Lachnospiraceae bacterium]
MITLLRAVYTDRKRGKIENKLLLYAYISGIIINVCSGDISLITDGFKMSLVFFLLLFPLYLIKGLGAGDIKLLCVLAMFFPRMIINVTIASFVIGAAYIIVVFLARAFTGKKIIQKGETIHFSIPIMVGFCVIYILSLFEKGV